MIKIYEISITRLAELNILTPQQETYWKFYPISSYLSFPTKMTLDLIRPGDLEPGKYPGGGGGAGGGGAQSARTQFKGSKLLFDLVCIESYV